jgi:pilus assembly protein CpaB
VGGDRGVARPLWLILPDAGTEENEGLSMNRKAAIPLVAGLVIGLVAVKLIMDVVKKAQGSQATQPKVALLQAKQDIKAYEKILPEMVHVVQVSDPALVPANERVSDFDFVKNRVAAKAIPAHVLVLQSMLAPEGTPEGIEGRIPPGYRAVAVKIDEATSAGYNLQPGDWVDVIVVMDVDTGVRGKKDTLAEVILQRVQIAAIGQGTNEPGEATGGKVKPAKSATLIVKNDDAPKLHLAGTRGKITLVMRGSKDTEDDAGSTAFGHDFMSRFNPLAAAMAAPGPEPEPAPAAVPAKPAKPPHTVMVYRGMAYRNTPASAERVVFENADSWRLVEQGLGTPSGAGSVMRGTRRPATAASAASPGGDLSATSPDAATISDEDYDADEE